MSYEPGFTTGGGRIASVLADALSDPLVMGDLRPVGGEAPPIDVRDSPPRADVRLHLRRMRDFDLAQEVDPRDPFLQARRQLTPSLGRDLERVEDALFSWLEEAPDRPARFIQDPAAVLRGLSRADARARQRVASALGRGGAPIGRLAGLAVEQLSIDTVASDPDPTPASHDPAAKETTAADAVVEVGLDQLARILDGALVAGVRQRASHVGFELPVGGQLQQGVLSLLLEDVSDPRLALAADSPSDTLEVTIGFPEATLLFGAGPLGSAPLVGVGSVEVTARLGLRSEPRPGGGGATVRLDLVPGSIAISVPDGLDAIPLPPVIDPNVRRAVWDAASAAAAAALAPFYTFAVPLTFGNGRCDIAPRGVTPVFRQAGEGTAPSLALFLGLLGSTPTPPPTDAGPSLVPDGADGHLLLSNRLMVELSCCLITQSDVWGNLPDQPTERASDESPCCRWHDISDVSVGEERFDTLELLEICAEEGLRMRAVLRKSGFGWSARAEITATATLRLDDGVVRVDVDTQVVVDVDVAWWLKALSVLLIIGGIVVIVVGIFKGNLGVIAGGGALVVLGLGLWTVAHFLPPDIRLPTALDDTDEILDLLPGGLREHFGALTFLTDAEWDDLTLSGFMTVPGETAPVAGGEVALAPGQALDLDTGAVVSAAEVPLRLDVDLVLRGSLEDAGVFVPFAAFTPGPGGRAGLGGLGPITALGRTLAAVGSSRLVPLGGRPFASVAEADLRAVVYPAMPTAIGVPGRGSSPTGTQAAVFAARSSAGRLAKGVTFTDDAGVTRVRFRTYDTPLLVTIETNHSVQTIGKPGVTDLLTTLNARFRAVPAGAWSDGRALTYEWFWQGAPIVGTGIIESDTHFTVVGDRCAIDTLSGRDLQGAICVVARDASGLAVTTCNNVFHLGRIPKPPDFDQGFGGLGGPTGPGGLGGPTGPGGGPGGPGGPFPA